jgi:organic radical activating enzyme
MQNLKTKIVWALNDFCKSECSYCPIHARGGPIPPETKEYLRVAQLLIDSYGKLNRKIDWAFNGGEPLDMDDIAMLLKLCRTNGNSMELNTNGGKLWMDWWAIEPYVDRLNLTYHYWQNPKLIKYIIDTFKEKKKPINVNVPVRPDHFDEDMDRASLLEEECNMVIPKYILYNNSDTAGGMFPYTNAQLDKIWLFNKPFNLRKPPEPPPPPKIAPPPKPVPPPPPPPPSKLVLEKQKFETTTFDERYKETYTTSPAFVGQMCNAGIEYLFIGPQGYVKGSDCNNQPLGNIWHEGWMPPTGPQKCTMIACASDHDRRITKFPLTDL